METINSNSLKNLHKALSDIGFDKNIFLSTLDGYSSISYSNLIVILESNQEIGFLTQTKSNLDYFKDLGAGERCLIFMEDGRSAQISYGGTLGYIVDDINLEVEFEFYANIHEIIKIYNPSFVLKLYLTKKKQRIKKKFVYPALLKHKKLIWVTLLLALFTVTLQIITPLSFQSITDKVIPYTANTTLSTIMVLMLISVFLTCFISITKEYIQGILASRFELALGDELFTRLFNQPIEYFDKVKTGSLTKLVSQVDQASGFLVYQVIGTAISLLSLLVAFPILLKYNTKLFGVVFGISCLMSITVAVTLKYYRKLIEESYTTDAEFMGGYIESVKGIKTILLNGAANIFQYKNRNRMNAKVYAEFKLVEFSSFIKPILSLQGQIITVLILFFGAKAIFSGKMTVGELVAFNMLSGMVTAPLIDLVMAVNGYENFKLAKQRLEELSPKGTITQQMKPQNPLKGEIIFDDVWFRYPDSKNYAVRRLNLSINENDNVGIVGPSGSGKSTLISLLLGIYKPNKGRVLINGIDISCVDRKFLRKNISVVSQESFLFNTSILGNVQMASQDIGYKEVEYAMEQADAMSFLSDLDEGILTKVEEDGKNFSGGQKQRICIARALARNTNIIIFDEATSALDNATESRVRATLKNATIGKTSISVAHRLSTLKHCDYIVVMKDGELENIGTESELLLNSLTYRELSTSGA